MRVNERAPVHARAEAQIAAAPEVVWDLIAGFEAWPQWNPEVESVALSGATAPGSEFIWKAGPSKIRSRLQEVERPSSIGWTGRTMGISAVHVWRFEANGGGTRALTEESWEGVMVGLMRRRLQKMLDKTIQAGLLTLKEEAERRAAGGA